MDGTFDTAPKLFTQLYVIRAKLGESAVSCAYALLTGKSQGLYEEMRDLEPLLDYFDATYVSGTYRPIRRPGENGEACTVRFRKIPPVFSPGLWNVHEATLAGGDRTNNH